MTVVSTFSIVVLCTRNISSLICVLRLTLKVSSAGHECVSNKAGTTEQSCTVNGIQYLDTVSFSLEGSFNDVTVICNKDPCKPATPATIEQTCTMSTEKVGPIPAGVSELFYVDIVPGGSLSCEFSNVDGGGNGAGFTLFYQDPAHKDPHYRVAPLCVKTFEEEYPVCHLGSIGEEFGSVVSILVFSGSLKLSSATITCYNDSCPAPPQPTDGRGDQGGDPLPNEGNPAHNGEGGESPSTPVESPSKPPEKLPVASCFAGNSLVQVEGKGTVRIDELRIGDAVLTSSGFAEVYSFGHKSPEALPKYMVIQTAANHIKPLEISALHLLKMYNQNNKRNNWMPAEEVKAGDTLVDENGKPIRVISVSKKQSRGAYTPLTSTGDIVVNGLVASVYVEQEVFKPYLSADFQHLIQHGAFAPYRIFCGLMDCESESYDEETGLSKVVTMWLSLERWLEKRHSSIMVPVFLLFALPTAWFVLNLSTLIALLMGYSVWTSRTSCKRVQGNKKFSRKD